MRAKTIARLCAASAVTGAIVARPAARKAKKETTKALERGAAKYVDVREKVKAKARDTGKPGKVVAGTAKLVKNGAVGMATGWKGMVRKAERERAAETNGARPRTVDIDELMTARN